MTIFMTDIPKALKLSKEKLVQIIENDKYNDFISEVTAHKGCGDTKVPHDKFVVLNNNEEFWVSFSQLNCTVYHIEEYTAESEVEKMIKLHLLTAEQ